MKLISGSSIFLAFAVLLPGPAGGQPMRDSPPAVVIKPLPEGLDARAGKALIDLARLAMKEYLLHRTPADDQQIPPEIKNLKVGHADGRDMLLGDLNFGLSMTIRGKFTQPITPAATAAVSQPGPAADGTFQVAETCARNLGNLCRNVISASLETMRSPKLPDRVTPETIDGLTFELEIVGKMTECPADALDRTFCQGLTGLCLSVQGRSSQLMPSACYLLDLDCRQAMEKCARKLPSAQAGPPLWSVFYTRQFVETGPQKIVRSLYRGKLLDPPAGLDEKQLLQSAVRTGLYLRSRQSAEGRYDLGDSEVWQHAYATLAMARLAGRLQADKDSNAAAIAQSVNAAMKYTITFCGKNLEATRPATQPSDNLAVASLLALAVGQFPQEGESGRLRTQLLDGIYTRFADAKHVAEQLSSGKQPPADLLRAYYFACMAMASDSSYRQAAQVDVLKNLRTALGKVVPHDQELCAWNVRSGVKPAENLAGKFAVLAGLPVGKDGPPDEIGALAAPGRQIDTAASAIETVNLASMPGRSGSQSAVILAARRFCHAMIFRPEEVYFDYRADDWAGGVRAKPAAAEITLPACAAAIEALLAK